MSDREKLEARVRAFALRGVFRKYSVEAAENWETELHAEVISRWRLLVVNAKQDRSEQKHASRWEATEAQRAEAAHSLETTQAELTELQKKLTLTLGDHRRSMAMRTMKMAKNSRQMWALRIKKSVLFAWKIVFEADRGERKLREALANQEEMRKNMVSTTTIIPIQANSSTSPCIRPPKLTISSPPLPTNTHFLSFCYSRFLLSLRLHMPRKRLPSSKSP